MPFTRKPDPAASFRFKVAIDGVTAGRFTDCSGLGFSSQPEEIKVGGWNSSVYKVPARIKFDDVTLKKGVATDGEALWTWVQNTVKGTIVLHNVTITLLDPKGQPIRSWTLVGAFPTKWSASGMSASSTDIVIEELGLAHQGMDFAQ